RAILEQLLDAHALPIEHLPPLGPRLTLVEVEEMPEQLAPLVFVWRHALEQPFLQRRRRRFGFAPLLGRLRLLRFFGERREPNNLGGTKTQQPIAAPTRRPAIDFVVIAD